MVSDKEKSKKELEKKQLFRELLAAHSGRIQAEVKEQPTFLAGTNCSIKKYNKLAEWPVSYWYCPLLRQLLVSKATSIHVSEYLHWVYRAALLSVSPQ